MRFYSPTSGQIFIDTEDISKIDANWLRNNVTFVQQDSILFNETIMRNIALGKRDYAAVGLSEIEACIELAMLQSTMAQLPQGADTMVGSSGTALSGGQRQRIAIARARLRDTPILLLDEATSALDYVSRMAVMDAIRKWRSGKTTIIITHDMSQIKDNDFVYVLDDGNIVQEGFKNHLAYDRKGGFADPRTVQEGTRDGDVTGDEESSRSDNRRLFTPLCNRLALPRRGSSYQHMGPSRPLSIFHALPSPPTSRRGSFTCHNPLAPGPVQRISSASPNDGVHHECLFTIAPPQPLRAPSRMSFLAATAEFPTIQFQGSRTHVGRSTVWNPTQHKPLPRPPIHRRSVTLDSPRERLGPLPKPRIEGLSPCGTKKSPSAIRVLATIWPTLDQRHRFLFFLAFLALLTNAAGPPVFSFIFSRLMTTFFNPKEEQRQALIYSLSILGVAFVDGIGCYAMHYLLESCGQRWVDTLRTGAYARIMDQPQEWFDKDRNSLGTLTACLDRNADEMRNLLGRFAGLITIATIMIIIAIIWSISACWKLTLVGVAGIPGLYIITKLFEWVTSRWERRTNDAADVVGNILVETFSDIRTVRALTLESYFHRKYNAATAKTLALGMRMAIYCGFWYGAAESAIHFVTGKCCLACLWLSDDVPCAGQADWFNIALIFWYGGRIAAAHECTVKSVLMVFSMLLFSAANANAVLLYIPQISSSLETAKRLLDLDGLPFRKSHEYSGTAQAPPHANLDISFNELSFTYPTRPGVLALKNVSLNIPSQKCTAIIGQSGSGKSTIASLLLRFYSPDAASSYKSPHSQPSLTISGRSLMSISTPYLRSLVALVPQTPVIFPLSVAANITYGLALNSPHSAKESIESAARAAGIHEFITTLPQGYDTQIGDGGIGISGGQAQRIVVARALVRKPRILILDEATSALDRESAEQIRETVRQLLDGEHVQSQYNQTLDHQHRPLHSQALAQNPPPIPPKASASNQMPPTVILITHTKELMTLGHKVVVMKQGRCVEEGTYDELKHRRGGELWEILTAGGME